ncbi:MAG: DUF1849 family protein [Pseudomonadota bacterium]
MKSLAATVLLTSLVAVPSTIATAGTLQGILPHRALYEVTLDEASDRSGIRAIGGWIGYELTGSACKGFSVSFQYATKIRTSRKEFASNQLTTTFEDAKGNLFRFKTVNTVDGRKESEIQGVAIRDKDGAVTVSLAKPDEKTLPLGPAVFANDHMVRLIDAAKAGETVYSTDVFDGSDKGDALISTNTFIGNKSTKFGESHAEFEAAGADLKDLPFWPVSVSYFDEKPDQTGEQLPSYQVTFMLYESGISRSLRMVYDDYTLKGTLNQLELLPVETCE